MKQSNIKEQFGFVRDYIRSAFRAKDTNSVIENSKIFFSNLMDTIGRLSQEGDIAPEEILEHISSTLKSELEEVCKEYGVSMEQMRQLVNDPNSFKPEDWQSLQKLKEDLALEVARPIKHKKQKIKKNKKSWAAV